jgi:hypothetical protein
VRGVRVALVLVTLAAAGRASALDFSLVETRHFAVRFGETLSAARVRDVAAAFEAAYEAMEPAIGTIDARPIDVVIFAQTGDFTAETGLSVWSGAATIDGGIYMQQLSALAASGVLDTTIRHEVCLVFLCRRFGPGMPSWIAEGLAVYHAGEIETIRGGLSGTRPPVSAPAEIDALLADRGDRQNNRWGYVLAYEAVRAMIEGAPAAHTRRAGGP